VGATPVLTVRSDDLDPLRDTVEAMANGGGSPRVLLLTGAPGVGKSTALSGLTASLAERGVRTHRVAADEMSRGRPYGLVAALLGMEPVYPPRADTADLAFEAVEGLCADGPAALCADDVHHADADSLALLGRLAAVTRDLPLALLLARRALPAREALGVLAARPDVRAVEVVGLDPAGLGRLVRARLGAPPGPELRALLATTGGNPFHAGVMLDDLDRHGRLAVVDDVVVASGTGDVPESVQAGARAHLALLDPAVRDLLQVLAVWGRPAGVEQLAAVLGVPPGSLLGIVQAAVASRVSCWTADELLAFQHDLYRDVVYDDLAPSLRRVLHVACAAQLRDAGGLSTQIFLHADGADDRTEPGRALQIAATELAHAPAQAADLLASSAELAGDGPQAAEIALARAGALAASGRMAEAERVARDGLRRATDPAIRTDLTRLTLHAMISGAHSDAALATLDGLLARDLPTPQLSALAELRRWVVVLDGRAPVDATVPPGRPGTRSGAALVPAALELFLHARCETALALAVEAGDARRTGGGPGWADGATAPIWPASIALYARGPEEARALSVAARRSAQEQGRGWLTWQHLAVAATIDHFAGRWDDALAELDTCLEAAAAVGAGYVSRVVGGLLQLRIRRGELDVAADGLARWKLRALPEQFGLPATGHAAMLLAEAQGRPGDVTEAVRRSWTTALDGGRLLWALLSGPEVARVAMVAGDRALLARVADDTDRVPTDEAVALAPAADLVRAMAEGDPGRAMAAATAFRNRGNVTGELGGWEEAAVAAAAGGDRTLARTCATRCVELATTLGAAGVVRRFTARLRAHDVRIGVSGPRRRPATGWQSLTPTELQVAELVGQGLTSPQIATRLYLSPRTVQTHISHSLRKLNLRSRVELATTVARHRG